jgi:DNA-binding NtrC family response regulator
MLRDDLQTLVQQMLDRGIRFEEAQKEFEKVFITRALNKTNFNVCKAARMTGLHRNTLSRKMAAYRIRKSA